MNNFNFVDYMNWLSQDCKLKFDNDTDIKEAEISVSDCIDLRIKTYSYSVVGKTKKEAMKSIIDMINASMQLLQFSDIMIFSIYADACAFCWIRDNINDDEFVK